MPKTLSALALALWLVLGIALAQPTPAGTSIANQASASYVDSAGQPRTTTSNQVITVVQQVYSLTITPNGTQTSPGQTRTALAGATVYFAYTVSNTGNGTDSVALSTLQDSTTDNFDPTGVTIYRDNNCNGALDAGETPVTSLSLARQGASGSSACVVVAATIPGGTPGGQYANLNLVGTSSGGPSDSDNWARATATTAAALTASKSASPSGAVSPGGTITYTIFGQNTGGSAASGVSVSGLGTGILVRDTIPNGLVVSTLPTGSAGAGTVQIVYTTDGSTWQPLASSNLPLTGNGTVAVGMFIGGSGAFFPQGASYTFSFQATVPNGAAQGTSYTNTAAVQYNNGSQNQTQATNSTTSTVGAAYNVAVGPFGFPAAGASGTYTAGGYTITRSGDTQSIASAYNGQTLFFYHTLRNTGNTPDSFTLSVSGAPTGWSCGFRHADHITPISGPVGPIAPGSDFNFDLVCAVPATYTGSTAVNLTVTATSTNDSSKTDTTQDTVAQVVSGYSVDFARLGTGGDGNPANDNPPAASANPGGAVSFPLEVVNTGVNPDSFNLSAPTLPSGWSVAFYPDANCDGAMDSPTPSPITNTGLVNPGVANKRCYIAVVQIPTGTAPGNNPISFRVDSATDADANTPGIQPVSSDVVSTAINVNLVTGFAFDPDRSGTVTSPGTITYTHNLVNTGNAQATVSIPAVTSAYGWTYQLSTDGSTWSASLSGIAVPSGGSVPVYVRVQVPGGQPIGRSESVTLTANATYPGGGAASDTATVTTTIVGGELSLTKSAVSYVGSSSTVRHPSGAEAFPGDHIVYTVVASNIGTGNLTNVRVSDPLPAYTSFVSVSAAVSGFTGAVTVLYSTNGTSWNATAPSSLPAGSSLYVGVDTDGNGTIDSNDTMPPGASLTLTLRVQVQ
ncbi:hypothetical protein Mlute_00533 [Meiothermus luteus]|uniref:DUF11 domain-containing protein n=1 Tax=Meiothermus luteus TaxID=2026184 RepID=A0A399EYS2_9DEIN|nr:DUF11 domain-containing protein [Meiothermus luteus]RIH88745.1 hypothetical protein Mlute_00533 [Meiothermus luteus]